MTGTFAAAVEGARVALAASLAVEPAFERAADALLRCLDGGGKILVCGNGGSAATAQHLTAELVGRYRVDRPAMPAVALTADGVTLTALANDYGYPGVFARQIEALGGPGDVVVALSTSGRSPNVVEAAARAKALGLTVVAITGPAPCPLEQAADLAICVPVCDTPRIQEVHAVIAHALAETCERRAAEGRRR